MDLAFDYVVEFGLESEADYGYKGLDGTCQYEKSKLTA